MKLKSETKLGELLMRYPGFHGFMMSLNPDMPRILHSKGDPTQTSLHEVAKLNNLSISKFLNGLQTWIEQNYQETVEIELPDSAFTGDKKEVLKGIIKDLHETENVQEAKQRFDELIESVDATELAEMEQTLIKEGVSTKEIQRMCDFHLAAVRDGLQEDTSPVPEGHPVWILRKENELLESIIANVEQQIRALQGNPTPASWLKMENLLNSLDQVDIHYTRKENQLFPFLEKQGITGPPQVMWGLHDQIRTQIKALRAASVAKDLAFITDSAPKTLLAMTEMVFKENQILVPMAMKALSDAEWLQVRKGESAIGYILDEVPEWSGELSHKQESSPAGIVNLDIGTLSVTQLNNILKALPVDISFVDDNDEVRYYTDGPHRIFPRSPGVIGRKVQLCHPPNSVHIVEKILNAFKAGTKNEASFWIEIQGKFLYIRYFAVRDESKKYLGTVEFMQDVTEIRSLQGQRRLLQWED